MSVKSHSARDSPGATNSTVWLRCRPVRSDRIHAVGVRESGPPHHPMKRVSTSEAHIVIHDSSRPKGAKTNQPRAERSGDSRGAPPWVRYRYNTVALKRRNKSVHSTRIVRQSLFRPFRAGVLDTPLTQGGATQLKPLRSALGCYVAAPIGAKMRVSQ